MYELKRLKEHFDDLQMEASLRPMGGIQAPTKEQVWLYKILESFEIRLTALELQIGHQFEHNESWKCDF